MSQAFSLLPLAGGLHSGDRDSERGVDARLDYVTGLLVSSDAERLYACCNQSNKIRCIKLSGENPVTTVCGSGESGTTDGVGTGAAIHEPRVMIWDERTNSADRDRWMFVSSVNALRRFDTQTGAVSRVPITEYATANDPLNPWGLALTASGVLIVTCAGTSAVYAVDPDSGAFRRIAGDGSADRFDRIGCAWGDALTATKFNVLHGMCLIENQSDMQNALFVADYGSNTVFRIELEWPIARPLSDSNPK